MLRGVLFWLPRESVTVSMFSKYNLNTWNIATFPNLGIRSRSPIRIPAGADFGSYPVSRT
jgi:hypothetical protein